MIRHACLAKVPSLTADIVSDTTNYGGDMKRKKKGDSYIVLYLAIGTIIFNLITYQYANNTRKSIQEMSNQINKVQEIYDVDTQDPKK